MTIEKAGTVTITEVEVPVDGRLAEVISREKEQRIARLCEVPFYQQIFEGK